MASWRQAFEDNVTRFAVDHGNDPDRADWWQGSAQAREHARTCTLTRSWMLGIEFRLRDDPVRVRFDIVITCECGNLEEYQLRSMAGAKEFPRGGRPAPKPGA